MYKAGVCVLSSESRFVLDKYKAIPCKGGLVFPYYTNQAMNRGISPNVVMKWTGHASYSSMKPYIDIVDSIKATEMAKVNFMD